MVVHLFVLLDHYIFSLLGVGLSSTVSPFLSSFSCYFIDTEEGLRRLVKQ